MSTLVAQLYQMEEQVVETFRLAGAISPQSAIAPPKWPAGAQRKIFKRFSAKRALVATADGRVWLDEQRFAGYMQSRSRMLAAYVVAVVVITIGAIFFT
jgi:hypothetical protein